MRDTRKNLRGLRLVILGIAIVTCDLRLTTVVAHAEGLAHDFLRLYDKAGSTERALLEANLIGLEIGFRRANAYLQLTRKQSPLYCKPEKPDLTAEQTLDFLRRAVRADPSLGAARYGYAILVALQRGFPCSQ